MNNKIEKYNGWTKGEAKGLMNDYALAFIDGVNFYEIAENIVTDYPHIMKQN